MAQGAEMTCLLLSMPFSTSRAPSAGRTLRDQAPGSQVRVWTNRTISPPGNHALQVEVLLGFDVDQQLPQDGHEG